MEFDREKFKQLVHYVIWKAGHRDWFGATKLYKALWFAEARLYVLTGKPITGAAYIRQEHGPVPRAIMPIREELAREGAILIRQEGKMLRFTALTRPDTAAFSPDELKTVDWWINHIATDHTAQTISDESHDYAWEIAHMGEELPFFALFASRVRPPDNSELAWAKGMATALELP